MRCLAALRVGSARIGGVVSGGDLFLVTAAGFCFVTWVGLLLSRYR
jgi:hypothetical protein